MKRKLISLLACMLLLFCFPISVFASDGLPQVVDQAGLFTAEEAEALENMALSIRQAYQMDVVILTADSLDGQTPQNYADDYYDLKGYGYGEEDSGLLFLLSLEERDWYISTFGEAIYALTDYGIQASVQDALPYWAQDLYFDGFYAWLNGLPGYLESYQEGAPVDGQADLSGDYYAGEGETLEYYQDTSPSFLLSLAIGLAAGGIAILMMRASMNSKRPQPSAASYLKEGSYHLRTHQDIFLYSSVTKRPRPKQTSSGGSSVHRSSGGRRHGGGGGKF